jgi:competence protein ComGC
MMRRTFAKVGAALGAIAVAAVATFAQTPPPLEAERHLPAGKTLAFISITDWKTADGVFQTTDLGRVWKTLDAFRQEVTKGFDTSLAEQKRQFERETGVAFDDAMQLLQGGLAAALVDMAPPEAREPGPAPVLAVSPRFKSAVEAFQKKSTPPAEPGQPAPQPPFQIVERPGALFLVMDPECLAAPGAKTLADEPSFKAVKAKMFGPTGMPLLYAWGNAESVLARAMAHDPEAKENLPKVGLADVKGVGLGIGFADGRIREALVVTSPGERKGLVKAFTTGAPLDVAALARRAPADCTSFAAARLDLKALLDEVIAAVKTIEPGAAKEIEGGLEEIKKELGLDLKADLLAALGDSVALESFVPEDGLLPEMVVSWPLRDAAKFEATVAKLAHQGKLEVKSLARGGRTIRYLQAPLGKVGENPMQDEEAMALGIGLSTALGAYVIDGGTLYTSALPQVLEDRFERAAKGSLADQDAFRAALAKAPQNARYLGWAKTRPVAGLSYHVVLKLLRAFEPPLRQAGVPVDTALLPRPNTFARDWLPSTSTLVVDEEGVALVNQGGVPVLVFLPALAAVGIQQQQEQKKQAQRMQVEWSLRDVYNAMQQYQFEKNKLATSIEELMAAGALQGFTPPAGYQIVISSAEGQKFTIEARPMDPSMPHMIIDETGYARNFGEPNPFAQPQPSEQPPEPGEGGEGGEGK